MHAYLVFGQKKVSIIISEVSIFQVGEKVSLYPLVNGHLTKEGDLGIKGESRQCMWVCGAVCMHYTR